MSTKREFMRDIDIALWGGDRRIVREPCREARIAADCAEQHGLKFDSELPSRIDFRSYELVWPLTSYAERRDLTSLEVSAVCKLWAAWGPDGELRKDRDLPIGREGG